MLGWECLVTAKAPQDPLDLSQIAAVLSAAAFRWHAFTWEATVDKPLRSGRGHDTERRRPDDPNTVYLPGTVRDRASTQRWLETVNADAGRA